MSSSSGAPPPSYNAASGGGSGGGGSSEKHPTGAVSGAAHSTSGANGISVEERRSMEDLARPLPEGWIRQFDPKSQHHFYVDTRAKPPRSIWHHPSDDGIDDGNSQEHSGDPDLLPNGMRKIPDFPGLDDTDDDEFVERNSGPQQPPAKGLKKFGQSVKNKVTKSTHEDRVAKRQRQREQERKAQEQNRHIRSLLAKASQTGQPQLVGRDSQGRDVYAQPPPNWDPYAGPQLGLTPYNTEPVGYGGGYGYGGGGMYGPPMSPYGRRRGYGYGGGLGMPLMMGGLGGFGGGLLLGGLLI